MAGVLASVVRRISESRKFVALMPTVTGGGRRRPVFARLSLLLCLLGMAAGPARLLAQTFQPVPGISFVQPFNGASPLAQVVSIGSTGAQIRFTTAASTTTGGSWLSISAGSGCCYYTPQAITVTATPAANLAVGTYTGVITVTASGVPTLTIPVSLTIEPSTVPFLDAPAGALTFSMGVTGKTPPLQPLPIRNAGSGTLNWTASASTSDGGGWLTLSSISGTAPALLNVGINPSKLPGNDLLAGTFTGEVVVTASTGSITVPVTISVGPSAFNQINPLTFTTAFGQTSPTAQVISLAAADGSSVRFTEATINSTGGNWLTVSETGCCYDTPQSLTVSPNPAVTLAAGTYTAEIVLSATDGSDTIVVPVTLIVQPSTAAFFDETDGALTFSMQPSGLPPASQPIPIRNAGAGTLTWTAAASTADGGAWLTLSAPSGTAPSTLMVNVNPANLPGGGLTVGTYIGQVTLTAAGDVITVPITLNVGTSAFRQINPLSFTKGFGGGNPSSQVISLANADASSIQYSETTINSTGGNWLTVSTVGCCFSTPQAISVSVNPDITLAAGTYEAEIVLDARDGTDTIVVPVSLEVASSTAAFFDNSNGALTFSMATGGLAPPQQAVPIRNAGTGTLAWTASAGTADGGGWITLSASSGTAPSTLNVGINPSNLPGGGLTAGTYVGQVTLTTAGDTITVPVSLTVGPSAFQQIGPLSFTKTFGGANPPSQVIDLSAQGAVFQFSAAVVNATGGSWLTTSINGCCYQTPASFSVNVNPDITLAAGTYTAEIILTARDGSQSMVVPVTLIIQPASGSYFDALPGALTYSMVTSGNAPPPQLVQIRNAGTGALNWTASAGTSDGGQWITLSATNGSSPYLLNIGVNPAALPGGGLIAGNYTGLVILNTSGDSVTIPVSMTVGPSVFNQINPLTFSKVYAGANPLPQVINLSAVDTSEVQFSVTTVNSTGGSWLSIPAYGCCYSTPANFTVSVNPSVSLAAGTYMAEIILTARDGSQSVVVPVTLNVEPATATFFDTLPGGLTFTMQATGGTPPAETLPIRNAGAGTMNWAATGLTEDGGKWLVLSAASGTAPANPTVSINPANLPGEGLVEGVFTGQVLLQTAEDIVTVPVVVSVGDSVAVQLPPVSFTKSYQGANPPVQAVVLNSTDASFQLNITGYNSTGANWLSIAQNGCCYSTPQTVTLTPNPSVNLPPGVYTSEIVAADRNGNSVSVIPVSLNITSSIATATPTFTPPGATYTTAQSVSINDATTDAAIYYTTDGSTPTTSSTRYTGPVQVAASETLQAIAIAPGYAQSAVGAAAYVINYGITVNPASYAFPNTVVGSTTMSSTLTLQNASATTLTGIKFSIAGANAVSFSLPSGAMGCGATLAAGASCSFAVSFTPTLTGTLTAFVSISDSSPGSPQTVALSGTGDPNTPTTVLFDGIGSSSLYLALGQAASAATTASPAGLGATCLWTTNKLGVVVATDSSVNGGGKTDTGSAWVAWTPVGGSCSTTNATTVVYAYLAADSVVANRCLFNGCTVKYGGSGTASSGLINATGEVPLAAGVAAALNGAGGNGLGVTAAGTDIRPEDAEFATARALTPCGAAVSPGSQYLGLGYTNGSAVKSYYSGLAFNVINFALPSAYTVTPIGASPLVVLVNGVGGGNGFSDPAITNLTSGALALFLDGTFAQTQDALTAPSTGTTEPITVLLREPLSGAYNLMEYGVVNTQSLKSSQDVGLTQQASEMNCTGTAVKSNPFTLPSGAGFRRRALSTAEELYEVSFRANALGYAFWSAENFKTLTPAAAPYTKYLTIDGVDPLQTTYTGGAVPTTPAQLANVTLANVANGSYPIWSVLRLVNIGASASTPVTSLAVAAQNFANTSAQPDFVPYNNLYAVHSHFIPPAGTGYPAAPLNGTARACGPKEAGGDVGGVVLTKAGDYDYCYDFGLTSGRTGLRR